ncbi:uncharacterized protein LACBIDRAFT_322412 [Laccaria bicolor S238N-H82]|uniref:Predicted protein n=1 Tax=Laccaria bicolor (strain S238N-H82 / ATCC MYA-4686) TaxID=486041 RepID=B0CW69_LACBS|nr:uncharacterized protein LACBIDRAFT_322412 [Laccaria bicolor S238N-H82]EDR13016.1 predicted protein [Laccaria bicolor S238N-H82]|eukprot:XP_001875514.1 predicted protein [Laccaria bicolor S238N-H82]
MMMMWHLSVHGCWLSLCHMWAGIVAVVVLHGQSCCVGGVCPLLNVGTGRYLWLAKQQNVSNFKNVTLDTKQKWATQGSKLAGLARAVMAGKKTLVTEMSGEVLGRPCMVIQNPDTNTPIGHQIISNVIPAIDVLQRQFLVSFSMMFSHFHGRKMSWILATLSCSSFLQASLSLTLHIMNRTLLNAPSPCTNIKDESDASNDDNVKGAPPPSDTEVPLVIIDTNYDRSHQDNQKFPIKQHYTDKSQAWEAGFIWTEKDRKKAMHAIIPKDMATFQNGHEPTLDQHLPDQLLDKFMALFPEGLKDTDTEEEGIDNTFPSIHFVCSVSLQTTSARKFSCHSITVYTFTKDTPSSPNGAPRFSQEVQCVLLMVRQVFNEFDLMGCHIICRDDTKAFIVKDNKMEYVMVGFYGAG